MVILLVRHAQPEVVPSVDPRRWSLSGAGRNAATELGARLPSSGVWVSSTEPKAYETLLCADSSMAITQDARFDEVRRHEPFDEDYRMRRLAWVEGRLDERHDDWETPQETAERFNRGVVDSERASPLVVASHGMAITAWLVHVRRFLAPHEAFPDVIEVD